MKFGQINKKEAINNPMLMHKEDVAKAIVKACTRENTYLLQVGVTDGW